MGNQEAIDVLTKIFSIYNLLLIVVSVILNPLVLFICLKSKQLRSTSTFKILAIASINDILICFPWNFESFVLNFNFIPYYSSLFYCKWISIYLQVVSLYIQSWLLLSVSLDRLLSLSINKWSRSIFINSRPYIFSGCLVLFFLLLNLSRPILLGYSYSSNGTELVDCYQNRPDVNIDWANISAQMTAYLSFIVPTASLIVVNSLIIWKSTRFERVQNTRQMKRKREMTRTILIITFLFAIITLPANIIFGFLFYDVLVIVESQMIFNLVIGIQMSYPAFNFFILYFSNKRFSQEVKSFIFRGQSNIESSYNKNIVN